ncbi:MAG: agmatinase family protein [Pseudomonadota bacterium]|nr:agmatinase family protein [Pseudomonadota bacterium]
MQIALSTLPLNASLAAGPADTTTPKPIIEMFADSPDAIPLDPRDESRDVSILFRDCSEIKERKPGPIDIQRTVGGLAYQGIPTFFRAPVALCPQDLKAGGVEVAIMGASQDMSVGQRGTAFGPQAVRTGEIVYPWGDIIHPAHPTVGDIDFMQVLNVVDYGDAPIDIMSNERSVVSVHKMVKEIAETGAIPVIVGGDHSLMYPDVVAVTDVYGKGKVGVVHFDAHFDGIPLLFGHYLSHGAPVRRLIDEGHVNGRNFVQIGLNSGKPGKDDIEWMRKNQVRYHFMAEIDKKGWDAVMKQALAEAMDGTDYLFISVDTDALDPAWAPGMGTPEPGGMSPRELFPILRGLAAQNKVVGIDLVELNPVVDPTYRSKLVAVRILRELLTGVAMHKKGITDPYYIDPLWEDNGVAAGQ